VRGETGEEATYGDVSAVASLPDKPSIAVLPFNNLSGDPDQDFIGDGLTEDIITGLSRIRQFFVIARNSTFQFKGTSPDLRKVAKNLGVRYVVEGSVRQARDRVRITAQLIDGITGNHLWAERYDREFDDLFAVQDEITLTIVAQLEPELQRAEYDRIRAEPPENLDAWELYHSGLLHIFRRTKEDILEGRELFEKAIERDPNFAGAYAGIAWTYSQDAYMRSTDEDWEFALRTAQRAVALDNRNAFAYVALGQAHASNGQIAVAISDYEEAIRINPSYALARSLLGSCLSRSGMAEEAISHLEFAIRLSPSDPGIAAFYARLAAAHLYLGQNRAAVDWGRMAVQKNATWTGRIPYTSALGHLRREDEARAACSELRRNEPDITVEFVQQHVLMPHQPYMDHLLEGLRKAGLPEE
jgi:TolB-like protein